MAKAPTETHMNDENRYSDELYVLDKSSSGNNARIRSNNYSMKKQKSADTQRAVVSIAIGTGATIATMLAVKAVRKRSQAAQPERDYGDRSGFPKGLEASRGSGEVVENKADGSGNRSVASTREFAAGGDGKGMSGGDKGMGVTIGGDDKMPSARNADAVIAPEVLM